MVRRVLFALAASLGLALLIPASAGAADWTAIAYQNHQRAHQVGQQIANGVIRGTIRSGVDAVNHWRSNYRPTIPQGALQSMPRTGGFRRR